MIENRRPRLPGATRSLACMPLLLAFVLLQACAPKANPGSRLRVFAADVSGGAKLCTVPQVALEPGKSTAAAISLANDGGWCGLTVSQSGPKPYDAGLLTVRPAHGSVLIHSVGDDTRIDYTPDRGFAGNDRFAVKLLPGNPTIEFSVVVTQPGKAPPTS